MSEPPRAILVLAGRLGRHDHGWSIVPFLDRLGGTGFDAQALCVEASGAAISDPRVVESPVLGRHWRLPIAVRGLRFDGRLNRPDLIHVLEARMSAAGLAIAEHWRIPYVQSVDEFLPAGAGLRLSRRWCRRLIATSRELADDLTTHLRVPSDLITAVNPGIEAPENEPVSRQRDEVAVIGTAGPLVGASGFTTFLNAARRVIDAGVDAEFVIAGQGEDEVDLRRRADRLRIAERVTFAGIPVVGLRFWDVLDVFCQPSLVASVGRALATALAHGVPAVASDVLGLRALVLHGTNGLRARPGDSAALAGAVLELLSDPARADALGRQGRATILRDFHPETEARRLAEVYAEVLGADTATRTTPADALAG
jgi:glycosyltransferase involved in cell wall biosynthesis